MKAFFAFMKFLTAILCTLLLSITAYSQVTGKLVAADGSPVGFASVRLLRNTDSLLIRSGLSDEKGLFSLNHIPNGNYILKISSVGYVDWISQPFEINAATPTYDTGAIILKTSGTQLAEVVIRSTKPLVQQEPGGLVVNVQNSVMTKGSSVLEVLKRSPGVIVDPQNTNISLNGKIGVMVMLDGKLLRFSTTQVAAMLSGMTADDIDKIELLSTPPAKYDADGNAGLINIVTKKNKKTGTNGSLTATAGYGKYGKASADLNLSHNTGKFSLRGSYSYSIDRSYGLLLAEGTENVPIIGGPTAFHYNGESKPIYNYQDVSCGLDYRASPKTTIGASLYYAFSNNTINSHNFGNYALPDSNLQYSSQLIGTTNSHYLHPSIYLEQTISSNQKLNIGLDYFDHRDEGTTDVSSNFSDSLFAPIQRNQSHSDIQVEVAKMDYTNQFNKQLKLVSGLKGTYTRSQSTAGIENLANNQWVSAGAGIANDLGTTEVIGAAYTMLDWQPDSLTNLSAGARYEYSHNSTNHSLNAQYAVDRRLGKLFPAVFISRKLNSTDELQLSYTERIQRPSFADLASYVSYNDPVSVFTGNPALKPTITYNLKLACNLHNYLFSLLYSRDVDPIMSTQGMPGPTKGLVYLLPENADWQNNLTLQATIPIKPASWWDMNYTFIGGWHKYRISYFPQLLEKGYLNYTLNFTESFKPVKNFSIELSGYYNSPSYYSNSYVNGNAVFNLGFKKEFKNNNGSLQLSLSDLFGGSDYRSHLGVLITDAFNSDVKVNYQPESHSFPIVRLSYFRAFGSNSAKTSRKDNNGTKDEQNRL